MKVIVDPMNLKKGMYISELDRPWLETPFLFQGFRITNQGEIDQIRSICDFVFVDVAKSTVPVTQTMSGMTPSRRSSRKEDLAKMIRRPLPYTEKFDDEFGPAWRCYQQATQQLNRIFDDIKMGRSLPVEGARTTVTAMVRSILRHPDALVLLASLGNKDKSLVTHALSVCTLSLAFGRSLGLDSESLVNLGLGALLHDIGKIKLPDRVLRNAANGSEEERQLLERHTVIGAVALAKVKGLPANVIAVVHDHHERANGSGYPSKLRAPEIGVHTKIVSIVDTYDSLTSGLHGCPQMSVDHALKNIYTWRRDLFDELLVQKFIQCIGIYPLGSIVELRTGQVGIVISSRPEARLLPRIMLVLDADKNPVEPPKLINLALLKEELDTADCEIHRLVENGQYDIDVRQYVLRELPLS